MSPSALKNTVEIEGVGLITGLNVKTVISTQETPGIIFNVNGQVIPASAEAAVNTDRGVTLASPSGQILSLVEHFLSACGMLNVLDWPYGLQVTVEGGPELPILDGSALGWVEALKAVQPENYQAKPFLNLSAPVYYSDAHATCVALPSESGLSIQYAIDFDHPDLKNHWLELKNPQTKWIESIAPARTFGFMRELPELQARGLAKGVSYDNTLGLNDDGSYTADLRFPDECLRHKVLDFIGDMTLCGVPLSRMNAQFILICAGHTSHIELGKKLQTLISNQKTVNASN